MHIAIGYRWFPVSAGYHLERALRVLGHTVTYVGLPSAQHAGYDSAISIKDVVASLGQPADLYLWIDPAGRYFPTGIEDLPIPSACYLIDVHLGTWRQKVAQFFDVVFVAQKDYLDIFRKTVDHPQVFWLPLAAASDVHFQLDLPKIYDVGFVGNIALAHRASPRARRLHLIGKHFSTNDFYRTYTSEEVGQVYSQSLIVFNTSIKGDVTMRVFEGTACGAMVLTDSVANGLGELFVTGKEIVTFSDDIDMLKKIEYYLLYHDERRIIAEAGRKRTLAEHTYLHRAQKIVDIVTQPGLGRIAPMRKASSTRRWTNRRQIYTHLHMVDALLDDAKTMRLDSVRRAWAVTPALIRRIVR